MTCGQKGKWPGVPLSRPSVAGQPKPALLSDLKGYCARSQERTRHMACSVRIPIRAIIPVTAPVSPLGGGDAHRVCRKSAAGTLYPCPQIGRASGRERGGRYEKI